MHRRKILPGGGLKNRMLDRFSQRQGLFERGARFVIFLQVGQRIADLYQRGSFAGAFVGLAATRQHFVKYASALPWSPCDE